MTGAASADRRARPRRGSRACTAGGFTLIEVLVALVVVALGMSALLTALNESASNVGSLRDKTVGEWIAMNQIALARLNLNAPAFGTTEGDVQNCGNGNWHWRQQVNAVSAIPGLVSITVSVRRTGDAVNTHQQGSTNAATAAGTPGSVGSLAPIRPLGPTAALGTVTTVSSAGCASALAPGSSLGSPDALGTPGSLGSSTSLGGPGSLGSSTALGASSGLSPLGASQAGGSGSASGASNASNDSASANSGQSWLVTLTGFRGTSLAAASGESPDWAGSGTAGTNGIPNGTGATPYAPLSGSSP